MDNAVKTFMKMTPELKAYKYYLKNSSKYLEEIIESWKSDDEHIVFKKIADKFGADYKKMLNFIDISYKRHVDRSLRRRF
jgi:hypothetical protein